MSSGTVLKYTLVGCALLASGVMAYDLCSYPSTNYLCEGNWGIPRSNMPQIVDDVRDRYLQSLDPTSFFEQKINATILTPIQNQLNGNIIYGMIDSYYKGVFNPCERPILVAQNTTHFNIIDGHHTATACKLLEGFGGYQVVTVILDYGGKVFQEILKFPGVFKLSFSDQPIGR